MSIVTPSQKLSIDTSKPLQRVRVDHERMSFQAGLADIIVRSTTPNSHARGAAIRALAAEEGVAERSLRRWVKKYERGGLLELARGGRSDWRRKRVLISRPVDRLLINHQISREVHERLAKKVREQIETQWASGAPSWAVVQTNMIKPLLRELHRRCPHMPTEELKRLCKLPRRTIEKARGYNAIAIYHLDKQKSADIQIPRVRRDRSHLLPMDWVAGDVHHLDIAFRREDGSLCTPKAVAWEDLATNRAFLTPFLMKKGEMIRREHVIQSFVDMCTHPDWGVPANLYLDRGSEYGWTDFIEDLLKLKRNAQALAGRLQIEGSTRGAQRSRAYNPQSKVIETLFSALERGPFAMLPGHIGGNRMKKKTENQGQPPKPYPHDFETFKQDISDALAWYHEKTQSGHLAGQSPNERFKQHVDAGWRSVVLDADELAVVFMEKKSRVVAAGGVINWDGNEYSADELIDYSVTKRRVIVGQPLFGDRNRLLAFTEDDEPLCPLVPVHALPFDDPRGAGEQARQTKVYRDAIRAHGHLHDPAIIYGSLKAVASLAAPSGAAPDGIVTIHTEHAAAASMLRARPETPAPDAERQRRDKERDLRERAANAIARSA